MGDKRFSEVVDWDKHIEPYRIIQFVAGVGSGKNYWVENELMNKMKVLLVTSRKAKVEETSERLKIGKKLTFNKLEKDALSACCVDGTNKLLDHQCKQESLPLTNRYSNPSVKSKITTILQDFPYLRYSILNDKFQIYRGKVWGERSYCESVTNFKHYVAEWQGEGTGIHCVAPFSIKSFLICPPKQVDSFEAYIIEHGLSEGKYMSKQEQDELLDFISNKLMLRQEKNKTKKYTSLAKAVRRYGWQLEPYKSKNTRSLKYGYARLIRIEGENVGVVWDDSI